MQGDGKTIKISPEKVSKMLTIETVTGRKSIFDSTFYLSYVRSATYAQYVLKSKLNKVRV